LDNEMFVRFCATGLCFISLNASQYQFVLVPTPKTWYDAQKYCRTNCLDLATIHDMEEMNKVSQLIEDEYKETVWFGLQGGKTGSWHWSLTGKAFYKEGEDGLLPSDSKYNCGYYKNQMLYTLACHELLPFICFDGKS
uniref:C-type lectin domain-containing protein n=1 Tax=Fundulus heteroclitus TaxID=8078 RepID=A0A3Q2QGE8_FUNHE